MNRLVCSYVSKMDHGRITRRCIFIFIFAEQHTDDKRPAPHIFVSVTSRSLRHRQDLEDMQFQLPTYHPSFLVFLLLSHWVTMYSVHYMLSMGDI